MIRNLVESRVAEAYQALRPRFAGFCGCDLCREDVLVFALNRVPPRYVTSDEGHAVTGVALEGDQQRTVIEVAVIDGLQRVGRSPRCGRRPPTP